MIYDAIDEDKMNISVHLQVKILINMGIRPLQRKHLYGVLEQDSSRPI